MLLPFQYAILTLTEAKILLNNIKNPKEYSLEEFKENAKIVEIYGKLEEFIMMAENYENNLKYLDPHDFNRIGD